jgi:hypothetical protein
VPYRDGGTSIQPAALKALEPELGAGHVPVSPAPGATLPETIPAGVCRGTPS